MTFSEEHRKNLSIAMIGKKRKPFSEETKQKMRKPKSDETKKKMSESKKGNKNPMKREEERIKNRERNRGEKSNFWIDGRAREKKGYSEEWGNILREKIRKRDGYTCQICGLLQESLVGWHKKLHVHHIDYHKKNCNEDNLITLCPPCHSRTHTNRKKWLEYFNKKLHNE